MDMIGLCLLASGYGVWLSWFVRLAWRGCGRRLVLLGVVMLPLFALCWTLVARGTADPASAAVLLSLACAVLPGPLVVAAVVYPVGRCRAW